MVAGPQPGLASPEADGGYQRNIPAWEARDPGEQRSRSTSKLERVEENGISCVLMLFTNQ